MSKAMSGTALGLFLARGSPLRLCLCPHAYEAFASIMASRHCDRLLSVGTVIMGAAVQPNPERTIALKGWRPTEQLNQSKDGDGDGDGEGEGEGEGGEPTQY